MTTEIFSRTELLLGAEYYKKLSTKTVIVFGLGGVGGYTVEALARSGVGCLVLIDGDTVEITNLNRQLVAKHSTIGMLKTKLFKNRIADINPECKVYTFDEFVLPETKTFECIFNSFKPDYVVDAVDTIDLKLGLASYCEDNSIRIISAMGFGNRTSAHFEFSDIYNTSGCRLCRAMRKQLRRKKVSKLEVLYSLDPVKRIDNPPASVPWVPGIAGLMIAGRIITFLTNA